MPRIDEHKEAAIRQEIRLAIATNPMISIGGLQKHLLERGYKTAHGNELDEVYLQKLIRKLDSEAMRGVDQADVNRRIMEVRQRFDAVLHGLFKIAYWKWEYLHEGVTMPTPAERVMALTAIARMDTTLLSAEMDAGIYKRKLGTLEVEQTHTLDPALLSPIMLALRNYGIVNSVIEQQPHDTTTRAITDPSGAGGN